MLTNQLKIDNTIYHNIMFLLNNLKLKCLEITGEDIEIMANKQKIKQLLDKSSDIFSDIQDPLEWQKNQIEEWQ